MAWEDKLQKALYALYHAALRAGLVKLIKYYTHFDRKPVYILALFLHPYFKLHYIKITWGGPEEQKAEFNKGNLDAKDWVDEALQIVECSLETYWAIRATPATTPTKAAPQSTTEDSFTSEYNKHCCTLLTQKGDNGWQVELRCYLKDVPEDVDSETDIVTWWIMPKSILPSHAWCLMFYPAKLPCECVFSSAKLTATDHCAHLGSELFEKLQVMKHIWHPELISAAKVNSEAVDCITLQMYESMLAADNELDGWEKEHV
ncbi:hypothetical protein DXG01_004110 [Tephrocybe rancida]|nr:hypothetical protein DXG01_004110 [Tephrocybe rancida]